jgi:hypothetical protein
MIVESGRVDGSVFVGAKLDHEEVAFSMARPAGYLLSSVRSRTGREVVHPSTAPTIGGLDGTYSLATCRPARADGNAIVASVFKLMRVH